MASDSSDRAEHARISQRLHDGPLQTIISARQDLDELRDGATDALPRAIVALDAAIAQLRGTIGELLQVDGRDLPKRIRAAGALAADRGVAVDVRIAPGLLGVAHDELAAIVDELVVNVARHARAKTLQVHAEVDDRTITVHVRDDGVGSTAEQRRQARLAGHLGLATIDRRVIDLGGSWTVRSAPGEGTAVTVTLPR